MSDKLLTQYLSSKEQEYRAKEIINGENPVADLNEYYEAWQTLSDIGAKLCESDELYLDKLICDGFVITEENYDELGGIPYRGAHATGIVANSQYLLD